MTWITGSSDLAEPHPLADSEVENYDEGAWSANVVLVTPWDDRHAVLADILDYQLEWPYRPGSLMYATKAQIVTKGGQSTAGSPPNLNAYEHAHINVTFERKGTNASSPGGSEGTAVYNETIEPNGEMLKLPPLVTGTGSTDPGGDGGWFFTWGETSGVVLTAEEAPTKLILGLDYVVRWTGLSTIPEAAFTIANHVNSGSVTSVSLGRVFAAETLLAHGPIITRVVTSNPAINRFDMECRFSVRNEGWNKFFDPRDGTFKSIWKHFTGDSPPPAEQHDNFPGVSMSGVLP